MDFHPSIVRLEESLIERAGEAMARAFFNDPLCVYMLPDEEERARLTPWHFSAFLRYAHLFGEVYTTSGMPDATAAWLPPGESEMTAERIEQSGLNKVPQVLGAEAWGRFARVSDYIEGLHPREASEPHWYLPLIGVDTPRQGRGTGGALLSLILDRADKDDLPAYLWTVQPKNVAFYKRHGFRVVTEAAEPSSGMRFWTCRRDPQTI
jgi:ribosomal protein S18 acetylase RimI-like enzyme